MILQSLSVMNYRNLEQANLEFSPNVNCFVGANGMGKSNVLDAIYYLSFCRGFSDAHDAVNLRHDADFFMLEGMYESEVGAHLRVLCSLKQGSRKHLKVDDKDVKKLSGHVGLIPLVMIAPTDSALVTGGSEERRKFLDSAIVQYDASYLEALIRYDRALKQRNVLLRSEEEPDPGLLDVLEDIMNEAGRVIYQRRKEFVEEFRAGFHEMYRKISGRDFEQAELIYESHGSRGPLKEQFRAFREKERIVGYTLHGVHRDDLLITLQGFPVKREASQGQQKTFFIALKLALFIFLKTKGERRVPLLLLDDIFDKLDSSRVAHIVDYVSGEEFGQIFITDTTREHLDQILAATHKDYRLFGVENGVVNQLEI